MQITADFRSDTVTRPTPDMRRAMAEAEVGDDVFGDDPTVKRLEETAAARFGKEAALFVPSGTMANLIAIKLHSQPGDEVFLEELAHSYNFEVGGAAQFAAVLTRPLPSDKGKLDPALVERLARPGDLHAPRTALLIVENTHNFHGGRIVPLDHLARLRAVTKAKGVALHMDGARLWNAIVASGVTPPEWAAQVDSLMFCLSKGLGAPVGSLLLGTGEFVERARRVRKVLGGGMRQAGVLAAAGLLALEHGPEHMRQDHLHAKRLAEGMAAIEGCTLDPKSVETNILFMTTAAGAPSYGPIAEGLAAAGILAVPLGELGIRFVLHRDVSLAGVERCLELLGELIPAHGRAS
ncbi:MAG: GntG family PLP-dependent aldolase [Planctomycetota bacterium]